MKTSIKLSAEERRAAIIHAVRRVFAEKGFDGTTTRALASAAGVSEALLFKHFPTKEALFAAVQTSCCNEEDLGRFEKLKSLEPSTSTLVLMVHFIVSRIVGTSERSGADEAVLYRLMVRSLTEDGAYARTLLRRLADEWVPKFGQCVRAAIAAGDADDGPFVPELGGWFSHHLATLIKLHLLATPPVVDYGMPRSVLVQQIVWFTLRGLGLREKALRRHYNPQALALFDA